MTPIAWAAQPVGTPNFVIRHTEAQRPLAEQVARAAEAARASQAKRWGPAVVPASWDPRCEIVLFPTAAEFSRETNQPPDSPGFSSMGMNEGRIVLRRVHLRADHPNLVKAILPHEVTHVVLADIFPHQQIPRWADEGMAVLSEPHTEQALRAADLDDPLKSGKVFKARDLMVMDYPTPENWSLYYAQSVSLTRYLVETGSPAQFIRLVDSAQPPARSTCSARSPPTSRPTIPRSAPSFRRPSAPASPTPSKRSTPSPASTTSTTAGSPTPAAARPTPSRPGRPPKARQTRVDVPFCQTLSCYDCENGRFYETNPISLPGARSISPPLSHPPDCQRTESRRPFLDTIVKRGRIVRAFAGLGMRFCS